MWETGREGGKVCLFSCCRTTLKPALLFPTLCEDQNGGTFATNEG